MDSKRSFVLFAMLLKVDSCFRDAKLDPTSTFRVDTPVEYDITMKVPVKNVQSMFLRAANVPKSMYPFITGLNTFVEDPDGSHPNTVTVPVRNYTPQQLATELTYYQLTDGEITYNNQTGKFSFTNDTVVDVTLVARSRTMAKLMGFNGLINFHAGALATTEFPNQVDLSWPRWLRLHVTVGVDIGERCQDTAQQFSYAFHFNGANFGEIESYTQDVTFQQREHITDVNLSTVHIRWELPEGTSPSWALSFAGVDHQLVFEVV